MNKKVCLPLLILLIVSFGMVTTGWAQPTQAVVPIQGTDNANTGIVLIGMANGYTVGPDSGVHGKEVELPPVTPLGVFDFRAVDPISPYRDTLGNGVALDLRTIPVSGTQSDTFQLKFKSSSDAPPTAFIFSWPAGLADSGGGRSWMLMDDPLLDRFAPIDMSAQTSFEHTFPSTSLQSIFIVIGDGTGYRTFRADSIALAKDSKGKWAKAEKRKPAFSEWEFTFTNPNATPMVGDLFEVKFSQTVTSLDLPSGFTATPAIPAKKMVFSNAGGLAGSASFTIHGFGDKGKLMKASLKWLTGQKEKKEPDPGSLRLVLKGPNINNIGYEIYPKGGTGLTLGQSASPNSVFHKDWKTATKSLNKKGVIHDVNAGCFDTYKGKPFKKQIKYYDPAKQKNQLVSEGIALKFNIKASESGNTPAGLGVLLYNQQPGDPVYFDGLSVTQISGVYDEYMSACSSLVFTPSELLTVLQNINNSFAGTFSQEDDTISYGAGVTVCSPVRALLFQSILRNSGVVVAPVVRPVNRYVEEVPEDYSLGQNYPNPFNPVTTIEFTLPEDAFVTLKVYNMLGQEIATLIDDEEMTEGSNEVDFDASILASGVYYYRLIVNDGAYQDIKKMMLLR